MTRETAFKIAMPVCILLLGELAARHLVNVRLRLAVAEQRTLAAYRDAPWAPQYFSDLVACASQTARAAQSRYARYVLQDINESCATPTINYADRHRRTWSPDPTGRPAVPVVDIGMFGGSTMEGLGAIDDQTIPSIFAHLANANASTGGSSGPIYRVTNDGVSGYTYTQSIMKLLTLLRDGERFDTVVFYGGANDVEYAYEQGAAGALDEEDLVRTRLEGGPIAELEQFGKTQLNSCVLCFGALVLLRHAPFVADDIAPVLVKLRDRIHFKKGQRGDDDVEPRAAAIARYYAQSHALLVAIAHAYHLRLIEAWQPTLMDGAYAPGEEVLARMDPRLTDAKLRRLYARVHDLVVAMRLDHFADLSRVLDDRTRAMYVDAVHVNGEGNRAVATELYKIWEESSAP